MITPIILYSVYTHYLFCHANISRDIESFNNDNPDNVLTEHGIYYFVTFIIFGLFGILLFQFLHNTKTHPCIEYYKSMFICQIIGTMILKFGITEYNIRKEIK